MPSIPPLPPDGHPAYWVVAELVYHTPRGLVWAATIQDVTTVLPLLVQVAPDSVRDEWIASCVSYIRAWADEYAAEIGTQCASGGAAGTPA